MYLHYKFFHHLVSVALDFHASKRLQYPLIHGVTFGKASID